MSTVKNETFTRDEITENLINELVFCEHFFNYGFICVPAPQQLTLYFKDGRRYVIILDKASDNYLSPQDIKTLLPVIYEGFFERSNFEEGKDGKKRVKNWIIPKHYMPCMIREDLYQEILEKDVDFFDKYMDSLLSAVERYLCEINGIVEMGCAEYKES